jgi:hypothetical protein
MKFTHNNRWQVPGTRRSFLSDCGMGMTGMVMGSLLAKDGISRAHAAEIPGAAAALIPRLPMIAPKARSVIWLFMIGGTSQMESFDPKPNLNRYQGKSIDETPFKAMLESPHLKTNLRELVPGVHKVHPKIFPMQIGYSKRGQSGIEVSDWWPHVGSCIDDIAVVRSMWTTDNNHGAQLQFHTGRHVLDGQFPTIGSWVHYGLGSLNENLPQFVVMGKPIPRSRLSGPRTSRRAARHRPEKAAALRGTGCRCVQ